MPFLRSPLATLSLSILILLSAVGLSASFSSVPPRPKIFVIGLSKTGTTSIGDALSLLEYRRLGWNDVRSRLMVHTKMAGEHAINVKLTKSYDAFEDLPWPVMYREMAALYPDAKFVLSLRRDEETWLRSMRTHVGRGKWEPYTYFYGADTFEGNEEVIRESYRNHTRDVREFFADKPGRLVELNIDDGDANWEVLCRVAECPGGRTPDVGFPRSNAKSTWEGGGVQDWAHWFWGWTVTRSEEMIARHYYHGDWKAIRLMLTAFSRTYIAIDCGLWNPMYYRVMAVVRPSLRLVSEAQ